MIEGIFTEVYSKFKLNFYHGIFERLNEREGSLTAAEAYAAEVIHALNGPTIGQFAHFLQVSNPNASYKVNTLIKKGYVERVQSETDKRESHLYTTQKFMDYYAINQSYVKVVSERITERFTAEELQQLEKMLTVISRELMPEAEEKLKLSD